MNDLESDCCDICLENFDINFKIPKIVECCNKTFCLKCLMDIFSRNQNRISCPTCRKMTQKNPNNLKVDTSIFENKLNCPCCMKKVNVELLRISFSDHFEPMIICNLCNSNTNQVLSESLEDYMKIIKEEMNCFNLSFKDIEIDKLLSSQNYFVKKIDSQIDKFVDNYFENLKKGLKSKMKNKILNFLPLAYEIDLDCLLGSFIEDYQEFKQHLDDINKITKIKQNDLGHIKRGIDYYLNKSDKFKYNGTALKKVNENLCNTKLFSVEENLIKSEEIESFLSSLVTININYKRLDADINFLEIYKNTGISTIDNELNRLRSEISEYKNKLYDKNNKNYLNMSNFNFSMKPPKPNIDSLYFENLNDYIAVNSINDLYKSENSFNLFSD